MIPEQAFGRSGHESSRVIFGAAAFWDLPQNEADATLDSVFSAGVNHVDAAASYGKAELRVGDWIGRHGKNFFLATKTEERKADKAFEELHRSLELLKVDQVDLWQLHNLIDPQEWEIALGPGGALEAAIQAREEGLVRFIGVTGHGLTAPAMHYRALERFDFDSVLLPYNYLLAQNEQYSKDFWSLVELCQTRNVAVQIIKSLAQGPWGDHPRTRNTWYRPLEEQEDINRAVHWILGQAGLFLVSAGDIHILPRVLNAADHFGGSPTNEEMKALVETSEMEPLFV